MRNLVLSILLFINVVFANAEEVQFADIVKASLVFEQASEQGAHYPHLLKVYLRLENIDSSSVDWVANLVTGVDAELFDGAGKPAKRPPSAASIQSNPSAYVLPYGSRLDLLISHGGISVMADYKESYVLTIGRQSWVIPLAEVSSYSLRIRLYGSLGAKVGRGQIPPKLLLELPATKIEFHR